MPIRVLSIGSDRKLFEDGSDVLRRISEYATLVEEYHIVVFTKRSLGLRQKKIAPNIWLYPTNSISRWLYPIDAIKIGKKINATLITTQDPFESGWAGVKLKKILKAPLEVQVHTDPDSPYFSGFLNSIRKMIMKKVLKEADGIRNVTNFPIYIDRKKVTGEPKFNLHDKYMFKTVLLMVSRLSKEKNIGMALEALKIIRDRFPDTGLVIVGSGPEKFPPQDNVVFVGQEEDLVSYYKTADVFLQTSLFEGYGLSLVEAGLSGLPVVSTSVGIAKRLKHISIVTSAEEVTEAVERIMKERPSDLKEELEAMVLSKEAYLEKLKENWQNLVKMPATAGGSANPKGGKLLILTQKVDRNDPVLGFFHRWILEFAKHFETVTVVCLERGEYSLSPNVKVLSLGKEKGNFQFSIFNFQKIIYIFRFYKYIWQEHNNYNAVFVHMNQEYVLLGGIIWHLLNKKIYFWRNHAKGNILTSLSVLLSKKVFYTSPQSFTAGFKNAMRMPVGIDTEFFKPDSNVIREPKSVLFLGRISPVKKVLEFINWAKEQNCKVTIAGPILVEDKEYGERVLKSLTRDMKYVGPVNQEEARKLYQVHETYVNFTPAGSMDKTIIEAAACGMKLEVRNPDLKDFEVEDHSLSGTIKLITEVISD